MPFTVGDLQDLLQLLEQQPQWKAALRAVLLGEEFLQLPALVRELAEAQKRTQEELRALAEAQRRTEQRVEELAEVQRQTEERVGRLEEALAQLAEAQRRTEERLGRLEEAVTQLAEAQRRTEERVGRLEERVGRLEGRVGGLEGDNLERLYRERAASYFQEILRRIHVLDHQRLGLLLDDALDAGRISREERAEILRADVILEGTYDGEQVYLLAEVSLTVTAHDARRARTRAQLLEKATGRPVLPAVAGRELSDEPETLQEAATVWRVIDGRTGPPGPQV